MPYRNAFSFHSDSAASAPSLSKVTLAAFNHRSRCRSLSYWYFSWG